MCRGLIYISEAPTVTLDASGATLEYQSGNETYVRRYPRPLWRRFLEREIRRLNEWEAANRGEVVPMGKRRAH